MIAEAERPPQDVEKQKPSLPFYDFSAWLDTNPETGESYFNLADRDGRVTFAEEIVKTYFPNAEVSGLQLHIQLGENGYLMKVDSSSGVFYIKILNVNNMAKNLDAIDDPVQVPNNQMDMPSGEEQAKAQADKFIHYIGHYHHPAVAQSYMLQPILGYFYNQYEGFSGYIMPRYDGGNLAERYEAIKLRQLGQENETFSPPLTWNEQLNCVKRFLGTLSFYEEIDVIHRDLKSENIMFHEQNAFVGDQDYMGFKDEPSTLRKMNGFTTRWYMAPEIMEALSEDQEPRADQRSEQYSAALVIYRLLSRGRFFFSGEKNWDESKFQNFINNQAFKENWVIMGHIVGKKLGFYYDLTKIFFASEEENTAAQDSVLYTACHKLDVILKKASALDPNDRYETMYDFSSALIPAMTEFVELIGRLQTQESQDPLWADPGKSIGRQRSRYEVILQSEPTEAPEKIVEKKSRFSRELLTRLINGIRERK